MHILRCLSMDSLVLLILMVTLMFAGGHCYSESMSCSMVNGRMICETQKSHGNTAGAFSQASYGQHGAFQDAAAMTGNTYSGRSQTSRSTVDGHTSRGFGVPNYQPNFNVGGMPGLGLAGTGSSDATSFGSNTGTIGVSRSGFAGTSNNNGIPGPAFNGFAVADSNGNNYYGGGNAYGGGYANGYGDPRPFDAVQNVFTASGLSPGFPFNMFGRRR